MKESIRRAVVTAGYSAHRANVFAGRMESIYEEYLGSREVRR